VINHQLAIFAHVIDGEVAGPDNVHFLSMQPKIKPAEYKAWVSAYSIVVSYLQAEAVNETASAVAMEFAVQAVTLLLRP
jgi:hypothetical protein